MGKNGKLIKFSKTDDEYVARRKVFSKELGPRELWSVIDHFSLYAGVYTLSRYITIADLLRSTLDVPGHVVEFGLWRGANLLFLAKLLRIYDTHSMKRIYGFDSFPGLETFSQQDGAATQFRSMYKGAYEELLKVISLYQMEEEIVIHKGEIEETLPHLLAADPALTFSFVYCDVDLYRPTKAILSHVHPCLVVGGFFVFDEYGFDEFPGETVAVNEFLYDYGQDYEAKHLRNTRQLSFVRRKLR